MNDFNQGGQDFSQLWISVVTDSLARHLDLVNSVLESLTGPITIFSPGLNGRGFLKEGVNTVTTSFLQEGYEFLWQIPGLVYTFKDRIDLAFQQGGRVIVLVSPVMEPRATKLFLARERRSQGALLGSVFSFR